MGSQGCVQRAISHCAADAFYRYADLQPNAAILGLRHPLSRRSMDNQAPKQAHWALNNRQGARMIHSDKAFWANAIASVRSLSRLSRMKIRA
jgi:hypothetical protein